MSKNLPPNVIAEIVRRLANAFPMVGCQCDLDGLISSNSIGFMLVGLDDGELDEVGMLFRMGILKPSKPGGADAEPAEMLRFLEQHGETWMLTRLEMMRAELRKGLARSVEATLEVK